jgi:hypothetical protein
MVDLGDKHRCRRLAHGAEHRKTPDLVGLGKAAAIAGKRFLPVGDNIFDLLGDKVVVTQHALNIASEKRCQRAAIAGGHCIEAFP